MPLASPGAPSRRGYREGEQDGLDAYVGSRRENVRSAPDVRDVSISVVQCFTPDTAGSFAGSRDGRTLRSGQRSGIQRH